VVILFLYKPTSSGPLVQSFCFTVNFYKQATFLSPFSFCYPYEFFYHTVFQFSSLTWGFLSFNTHNCALIRNLIGRSQLLMSDQCHFFGRSHQKPRSQPPAYKPIICYTSLPTHHMSKSQFTWLGYTSPLQVYSPIELLIIHGKHEFIKSISKLGF